MTFFEFRYLTSFLPESWGDLKQIGVSLIFVLALRAGWLALNRLYWHPLRQIPGPLLAGLTEWWEFYFDVIENGTLVQTLPRLHQKYRSPVIRISPNHVHVNDPDFYNIVYRAGTDYRKAPSFYKALGYPNSLISILDPQKHRVFRNTIAPLFSPAALDLCAPRIHRVVLRAASKIVDGLQTGSPIQIQQLYRCLAMDVIYVTLFGQHGMFVDDYERPHELITSIDQFTDRMWLVKHFPIVNKIALNFPGYARFRQQCESWVDEVRQRRSRGHLTTSDGITTIFDAMLQPNEQKGYESRTSEELIDEAALFIIAGSDTSAYTLTSATYYLLTNPCALARLRNELDTHLLFDRAACKWEEVRKLPYLTAVIKETLRLSTPIPGITPRVVPAAGVRVQDYFLPGGTIVSITHRSIHDNPDIFPEPTLFQPERWLGEKGKALDRWLVAFSKGSRQCIGSPLAYQEAALTLAHIFGRFELQLHETDESNMSWVDHAVAVNSKPVQVRVLEDRWSTDGSFCQPIEQA
ncbi:cytochrome P450 [Aspergillus saccharolyticus JOP 1030-1]|uniref:Cytochrome P450 n=1 Tax=Aspergillus saccharolyticus JOP 1030-1 TaxID=1450539 RepID=A0A318ZWK1_9EURO|nr:cytochrome P450 [Aspergillus saccharolyticus JOP 1030-1]PYH48470.1 cytochrome P450 [Aspergillus saccharolyticus JOP 1030-1]